MLPYFPRRGISLHFLCIRVQTAHFTSESTSVISNNPPNQGGSFNELFVKPTRKLRAQIQLERVTGRMEQKKPLQYITKSMIRHPRKELISSSADWTNVWPSAGTFRSSVVPLPIRMGYRVNPKKQAPFKPEGNLELLKIPNFLHLSPEHITRHCSALKKFCTTFPLELMQCKKISFKCMPITIQYDDYIHQGTNIRDMRSRVATIQIRLHSLRLDTHAHNKMKQLLEEKYDVKSDIITLSSDRCPTRKQNLDYAYYMLVALYHESNKVEEWERLIS